MLPRYDKDRKLVSDLKAEIMTLIDPELIQGETVMIKFYHPDRSLRGKVELKQAVFNQTTSHLRADEPVKINTDRLIAIGDGLIYSFQNGQGFLIGPATTWISYPDQSTSMRPNPTKTAALIALCMAPSLAIAKPPANVSTTELTAIKAAAAPSADKVEKEAQSIEATLKEDINSAQKASDTAHEFAKSSGLENLSNESEKQAEPLVVSPGPNDTIIKCDGGMYFDAEAGVLVYLKNVRVSDPRFDLAGADELKVFFDQKESKKPAAGSKKSEISGPAANFGDVKKLIATGTVRFVQKSVAGKEPVEASGGILTYDVPKGEIIISQRYPWVKQGKFYARAKQPNLTLRLLNNGSFTTQGNWEMGGNLNMNKR